VRKITTLNEKFLQHSGPTDVLSFPQQERGQGQDIPCQKRINSFGDVVISFPDAVKLPKDLAKWVDQQICFYLEHALLHLLGYHHDDH
jgi:probable rRNA maturation factor